MNHSTDVPPKPGAATRWYDSIVMRIGPKTREQIWSDWTDKLYDKEIFHLDEFRSIVARHSPDLAPKTVHDRTTALLAYFCDLPSDLKRNPDGHGYIWRSPGELEELLDRSPA